MTTPPPLRQRPLMPGRGRVYRRGSYGRWFADYRTPDGALYGVWALDPADGHDWIHSVAKEAAK